LAMVLGRQGKPIWATRLLACAQGLRDAMGQPISPLERLEYDAHLSGLRTRLDSASFRATWTQGSTMTAQQALDAQEERVDAVPARLVPPRRNVLPPQAQAIGLTRRELEVLRQLCEGLTNKEIAERLVLSRVTVNSYLRSIYSKMGVSTRAAAVRYALDHHLLA